MLFESRSEGETEERIIAVRKKCLPLDGEGGGGGCVEDEIYCYIEECGRQKSKCSVEKMTIRDVDSSYS